MSYRDLLDRLKAVEQGQSIDTFGFLASLSTETALAESDDEVQKAREICVRVLDQLPAFEGYEAVIQALLRKMGLFPYLDEDHLDVATQLATEAHRPAAMPEDVVFTAKQAEVYRELLAGRNVVLSAPTSFGKSLIIDAIIASGLHSNIVVVVPTLALVDETRRRLLKFSDRYKVITHLSQEPAAKNIFVHTQERVVENPHIQNVDFFVIDEFYKLNIDQKSDSDSRGVLLNQAFYRLAKRAKQFYMLGPNIDELPDGFGKNFRCTFIKTDFSTVASETHLVPEGPSIEARLRKLVPRLEGPTLIFSGSVASARKLARAVASSRSEVASDRSRDAAVEWLSKNFHPKWGLVEILRKGVGVHHGKLPRSVAQMLVRLFNDRHIDFLVCTSTLIEGVNTAARNVVVADDKINRKKYDFFTFNNIKGRSGRMWQHYIGHVYLFHPPPQKGLEFVDVPAFTQGVDVPEALLIQMDKEDLSPLSRDRLDAVWSQRYLSVETIQANSGFGPHEQIALARYIEENIGPLSGVLNWTGLPRYEQLKQSLELAWTYFGASTSTEVRSASQLTLKLWKYQQNPDLKAQISAAVGQQQGEKADEALEGLLDFIRQWVQFRAPRMLFALEKIQAEVFRRRGISPGNYQYYCSRLESLFLSPVIVALEEYGVPVQLAQRLVIQLEQPSTLDDALDRLKRCEPSELKGLSSFEQELILPLCRPLAANS